MEKHFGGCDLYVHIAALYKMFSCQGGLNWIYSECTVKKVLLSRWFDLVRHGYGTSGTKYSAGFSKRNEKNGFCIIGHTENN